MSKHLNLTTNELVYDVSIGHLLLYVDLTHMCSCIIFANILYYYVFANVLEHANVIFQHQLEPKHIFLNLKIETIWLKAVTIWILL